MIAKSNSKQIIKTWQNADILSEMGKLDPINKSLIPVIAINTDPKNSHLDNYITLSLSWILMRQNFLKGQKTKLFWIDETLETFCNNSLSNQDSLIVSTGLIYNLETFLKKYDFEYLQYLWVHLGNLWLKGLIRDENQIQGYNPEKEEWLSSSEINYENQKSLAIIAKFEVKYSSKNKLLSKVIEQVHQELIQQQNLLRQIQIKLSKEVAGNVFNSIFNSVPSLEPKNPSNNIETQNEEDTLTQELTVKANIETLKELRTRLNADFGMFILSWVNQPWLVPASTALLVNPTAQYSLFYSELKKELYLVSESQAKTVINFGFNENSTIDTKLDEELNSLEDSGDYFDKLAIGMHKIVTFLGSDLQGLEYQPPFEINQPADNINSLNLYKIYTQSDIIDTIGTGIYLLTPAYNAFDYVVATKYNLPIISHLNEQGQIKHNLFSDNDNGSILETQYFLDSSNLLIGIMDKNNQILATFEYEFKVPLANDSQNRVYFGINKAKYVEPQFWESNLEQVENLIQFKTVDKISLSLLVDRKFRLLSSNGQGLPLPIWRPIDASSNLPNIVITSFEQILKYVVNPVHKLINFRELNQGFYLEKRIVIVTDKFMKLPLGITAVQYRSTALTELHRQKYLEAYNNSPASVIFQNLFVEIQELFNKYQHVQLLLDPHEQCLLTQWLLNSPVLPSSPVGLFYFYQPIEIANQYQNLQNNIRLLDWSKEALNELVITDEIGNNFITLDENLLGTIGANSLLPFIINQKVNNHKSQVITQNTNFSEIITALNIFGLNNYLDLYLTGRFVNTDEYENYSKVLALADEYGADSLNIYFCVNGLFKANETKFDIRNLAKISKQIDFFIEQFINWYTICLEKQPLPTLITSINPKKLINQWWQAYSTKLTLQLDSHLQQADFAAAGKDLVEYFENLGNWYLPRAKNTFEINPAEVVNCVSGTLLPFCYVAQCLIPINAEKLYNACSQSRQNLGLLIFSKIKLPKSLNSDQIELLESFEKLNLLISDILSLRQTQKIRLRQPLYIDIQNCTLQHENIDLLLNDCNLIIKNMDNIEGETAEMEGYYGKLTIDLVIDEQLANLGYGRDFERAVQDFRKQQGFKHNTIIKLDWQLDSSNDWELVQKVVKNINWSKLNVEIKWVEGQDTNNVKKFEVKELCTIWVWEKE